MLTVYKTSDAVFTVLALGLLISGLVYMIGVLDIAANLSDSSFYILMTQRPEEIDNHFSMFGIIWRSLAGQNSIYVNRVIHVFALLIAGGALGYWGVRLMAPARKRTVAVLVGLMSASAYLNYFGWGLIDPSYNSLIFILYTPCLLSFVVLNEEIASSLCQRRIFNAKIIMSGFILAPSLFLICFVKPPAGLAVIAFMFIMLLNKNGWNAVNCFSQFLKLAGIIIASGATGIGTYFTIAWLRLFSPLEHWSRFWIGYAVSQEKAGGTSTSAHLMKGPERYIQDLAGIVSDNWLSVLVLLGGFAVSAGLMRVLKIKPFVRFGVLWIFVIVSLIVAMVRAYNSSWGQIPLFKNTNWLILVCMFLAVYFALVSQRKNSGNRSEHATGSKATFSYDLFIGVLLSGFFLMFGTGNRYIIFLSFYSGAFVVAGFLAASVLESQRRRLAFVVLSIISVLMLGLSFTRFERFPYRLGGPISEANVEVIMGESDQRFRATQQLANSYNYLAKARETVRSEYVLNNRPMLLDMTGRAPGFNIYLGLKPPRVGWLIGGYKGSDRVLSFVLSRLSDEETSRAWIIIREAEHRSNHSTNILNARLVQVGRQFPADYESVGTTLLAENKRNVRLYRPKPR